MASHTEIISVELVSRVLERIERNRALIDSRLHPQTQTS